MNSSGTSAPCGAAAPPIGVVVSLRARRHRQRPGLTAALRRIVGNRGIVAETATPAELRSVALEFRERGVRVLALSGGDGSAGLALTAFSEVYGDAPIPKLALLRGGTMNTVANAIGVPRLRPEALLRRVDSRIARGLPLATSRRVSLRVHTPGAPARLGFLFGTGLGHDFLAAYYALGGSAPTSFTAVRALAKLALGFAARGAGATRRSTSLELAIRADECDWPARHYASVLAGSVEQIGLGFRPFFRAIEGATGFHLVAAYAEPAKIVAQLGRVWRGLPLTQDCAHEALVRRARLTPPTSGIPYFLDGDLHVASDSVCIETGPPVCMVR